MSKFSFYFVIDWESDEYFATLNSSQTNKNDSEIISGNSTKPARTGGLGKYAELLFLTKSKIGWVGEAAMPTGWITLLILIVMATFSMPFIRKKGHFQVKTIILYFKLK